MKALRKPDPVYKYTEFAKDLFKHKKTIRLFYKYNERPGFDSYEFIYTLGEDFHWFLDDGNYHQMSPIFTRYGYSNFVVIDENTTPLSLEFESRCSEKTKCAINALLKWSILEEANKKDEELK